MQLEPLPIPEAYSQLNEAWEHFSVVPEAREPAVASTLNVIVPHEHVGEDAGAEQDLSDTPRPPEPEQVPMLVEAIAPAVGAAALPEPTIEVVVESPTPVAAASAGGEPPLDPPKPPELPSASEPEEPEEPKKPAEPIEPPRAELNEPYAHRKPQEIPETPESQEPQELPDVSDADETATNEPKEKIIIIPESKKEGRLQEWQVSRFQAAQAAEIEATQAAEGTSPHYIINSPLEGTTDSFAHDFASVVPFHRDGLRDDIESTLADIPTEQRTAVELGGNGSNLFAGFSEGFFAKTVGVSLADDRNTLPDVSAALARDEARNHTVVPGNMLEPDTQQQVQAQLNPHGGKASLIIERMMGGHNTLPIEPFGMAKQVSGWYEKLAEGGLLYAEVPTAFIPAANVWTDRVRRAHPQLDIRYNEYVTGGQIQPVIRIHKKPGAPEELPLLTARQLFEAERARRPERW